MASEQETGEREWKRAQELVSSGRADEAEGPLSEAERAFRESGNEEKLLDVLVLRSRTHLILDQVPEALRQAQAGSEVVRNAGRPLDERELLFQRGLASLQIGRLEDAQEDLSRYLALAEETGDLEGQVKGHFHLALVYERNGEPCMAAAEVEMGRDVAGELGTSLPYARLTAFLAHLWLRRGETEQAEALSGEALRSAEGASAPGTGPCLGMALLVDAELKALRSDLEEGERSFRRSMKAFQGAPVGRSFYQAVADCWYGETLAGRGRVAEGRARLEEARMLFEKLHNDAQAQRAEKLLADLDRSPC